MEPRRARGLASVRLSPPVTPEGPLPSGTADTSALFPFTCQMPGCFFSHRAFLIFFFFLNILSCPTGFSHCLHLDLWTLETLLWGDCQAPMMRLCLGQLPSNLRGAAAPGRGGPQLSSVSFQEGGHTSFCSQAVTQSLVIYLRALRASSAPGTLGSFLLAASTAVGLRAPCPWFRPHSLLWASILFLGHTDVHPVFDTKHFLLLFSSYVRQSLLSV